jgi:hypothetical protein
VRRSFVPAVDGDGAPIAYSCACTCPGVDTGGMLRLVKPARSPPSGPITGDVPELPSRCGTASPHPHDHPVRPGGGGVCALTSTPPDGVPCSTSALGVSFSAVTRGGVLGPPPTPEAPVSTAGGVFAPAASLSSLCCRSKVCTACLSKQKRAQRESK